MGIDHLSQSPVPPLSLLLGLRYHQGADAQTDECDTRPGHQ